MEVMVKQMLLMIDVLRRCLQQPLLTAGAVAPMRRSRRRSGQLGFRTVVIFCLMGYIAAVDGQVAIVSRAIVILTEAVVATCNQGAWVRGFHGKHLGSVFSGRTQAGEVQPCEGFVS